MLKTSIALILFLSFGVVQAQHRNKRDSLLNLIRSTQEDTIKVILLLRLASNYETNNQDSSIYYLQKAKILTLRISIMAPRWRTAHQNL